MIEQRRPQAAEKRQMHEINRKGSFAQPAQRLAPMALRASPAPRPPATTAPKIAATTTEPTPIPPIDKTRASTAATRSQ